MFTYESTQFDIEGFILVFMLRTFVVLWFSLAVAVGHFSFSDQWCTVDISSDIATEARAWYVLLILKLKSL